MYLKCEDKKEMLHITYKFLIMKEMRVMKNRNTLFCHCLNYLAVSECVYICCLP